MLSNNKDGQPDKVGMIIHEIKFQSNYQPVINTLFPFPDLEPTLFVGPGGNIWPLNDHVPKFSYRIHRQHHRNSILTTNETQRQPKVHRKLQ